MTDRLRIVIGSDDAGFTYKEALKAGLEASDLVESVVDVGVDADGHTGYPTVAIAAAEKVAAGEADRALLVCGTGIGVAIAANKVEGIRCALAWSDETAALAREHNDANVVSVGGRMHPLDDMTRFVEIFLTTPFSGDERHVRRIAQLSTYDGGGGLPPLPESARVPQNPDLPGADA